MGNGAAGKFTDLIVRFFCLTIFLFDEAPWIMAAALKPWGGNTLGPNPVSLAAPAALQGQQFKDWLRQNWYYKARELSATRLFAVCMYNYIDNQTVVCGYLANAAYRSISSNTSPAAVSRITGSILFRQSIVAIYRCECGPTFTTCSRPTTIPGTRTA
jgi:hypothetical protein